MVNIRNYIREVADFPKKGISFKDITPLLSSPIAFDETILQLQKMIGTDYDIIAGLDARGFIFGSALALIEKKPFIPMRKKGKLPYTTLNQKYELEYGIAELEMHTDAVKPGQKVVVIDDLLATGGTAKAACDLIEKAGGEITGCYFVVELDDLKGRDLLHKYRVHSLLHYKGE